MWQDNIPLHPNVDQLDSDSDESGDACDTDDDTIFEYDEVTYDGDANSYNPATDLNPTSNDTFNDSIVDNLDPVPLECNVGHGDLAT